MPVQSSCATQLPQLFQRLGSTASEVAVYLPRTGIPLAGRRANDLSKQMTSPSLPSPAFQVALPISRPRRRPPPLQRTPRPFLMSISVSPGLKPAILLTNDDGLDPSRALILPLAHRLVEAGHSVVVVAPSQDNSACGQRITMGTSMTLRRHPEQETLCSDSANNGAPRGSLAVFSLDAGTPSDCVIAAVEPGVGLLARLGSSPALAVSGVNLGPNMGNDVLYSGTFAAARQAAMYGVPALAASLDLFVPDMGDAADVLSVERALDATERVTRGALKAVPFPPLNPGRAVLRATEVTGPHALRDAFARGDVVLNVNVPRGWEGEFATTSLDAVVYREPMDVLFAPTGVPGKRETLEVRIEGAKGVRMWAEGSDTVATMESGQASVTPVSTWPQPHPLAVPPELLRNAVGEGLPNWLEAGAGVEVAEKTV